MKVTQEMVNAARKACGATYPPADGLRDIYLAMRALDPEFAARATVVTDEMVERALDSAFDSVGWKNWPIETQLSICDRMHRAFTAALTSQPNCTGTWPNRDNCGTCPRCLETAAAEVARLREALDAMGKRDEPHTTGLWQEVLAEVTTDAPREMSEPRWTRKKEDALLVAIERLFYASQGRDDSPAQIQFHRAGLDTFSRAFAPWPPEDCPAHGTCVQYSECQQAAVCPHRRG